MRRRSPSTTLGQPRDQGHRPVPRACQIEGETAGESRRLAVAVDEISPRPNLLVRGRFPLQWRRQDSNLGRRSRQIYSPLTIAWIHVL